MNISNHHPSRSDNLAELFQLIGQPTRIQILLAIGESEVCVCHLEAATGLRQAVISQHLMLLRKAGLVSPNRAGRNIFYRLENPALLDLINTAAVSLGIDSEELLKYKGDMIPGCPCPKCEATKQCKAPGEMNHD
jgi:ArsR family transcriptional regulator, lead/cadmium/zinc/bismuth-responsive transcriptional repressor